MKVELISYTPDALALLLFTKNTRLMGANSLEDIKKWYTEKKLEHLAYMKDTIQSSWEFVEYTFHISEVTRAFTHQLVRTRTGSYAQQSQRTVDVREMGHLNTIDFERAEVYGAFEGAVQDAKADYAHLIDVGIPVQDARGLLPTNMHTEIIAKFSLRTLHDMALVRLCTRTQGEYQDVFKAIKSTVVKVHPWAEDFIKVSCAWDGVCAFPRYTDCPVQSLTYNADTAAHKERIIRIQEAHDATTHVANPVAKDGRTM